MINFKLFFVIFLLNLHTNYCYISDKRLCANEQCTKKISQARTIRRYGSPDPRILSFPANVQVTIYSKDAGSNKDLWGAEYMGKRGYLNKNHIREEKIFTTQYPFEVDTELDFHVPSNTNEVKIENIKPHTVQENYEIVDGTKIPHNFEEDIQPNVVETFVQSTAIPQKNLNTETENNVESKEQTEEINTNKADSLNSQLMSEDLKNEENELKSDTNDRTLDLKDEKSLYNNVMDSLTNWLNVEGHQDDDDDDDDEDDEDEDENEDKENLEEEKAPLETPGEQVHQSKEGNSIENVSNITDIEPKSTFENNTEALREYVHLTVDSINETKHESIIVENIDDFVRSRKLLGKEDTSKEETTEEPPQHQGSENVEMFKTEEIVKAPQQEIEDVNIVKIEESVKLPQQESEDVKMLKGEETVQPAQQETEGFKNEKENNEQKILNTDTQSINFELGKTEIIVEENVNVEDFGTTQDKIHINENQGQIVGSPPPLNYVTNPHYDIPVSQDFDVTSNPLENVDNQTQTKPDNINVNELKSVEDIETIQSDGISLNSEDNFKIGINDNITALEEESDETNVETVHSDESSLSSEENLNMDNEKQNLEENLNIDNEKQNLEENMNIDNEKQNLEENLNIDDEKQNLEVNFIIDNEKQNLEENLNINNEKQNLGENFNIDNEKQNLEQNLNVDNEKQNLDLYDITSVGDIEKEQIEEKTNDLTLLTDLIVDVTKEELKKEDEIVISESISDGKHKHDFISSILADESRQSNKDALLSRKSKDYESCPVGSNNCIEDFTNMDVQNIEKQLEVDEIVDSLDLDYSYLISLVTLLVVTGISVIIFLFGYMLIDKSRKEAPLIAKINNLEKALLIATKENQLLSDKIIEVQNDIERENDQISNETHASLQLQLEEILNIKAALEEQVQSLEKELENSTEVGLELNKMISDILSSQNASDTLMANVEQLQRQLVEQQSTINTLNATLNLKDTENHELQLDLEINNKKVTDLQAELDKMVLNLLKIEEEKETTQSKLESELTTLKERLSKVTQSFNMEKNNLMDEISLLKTKHADVQRNLELKINEYTLLKDSVNQVNAVKNNTETLQTLLDVNSVKAEVQQLQRENQALNELLQHEQQTKYAFEKQAELAIQEVRELKNKYDEADREKLEALTKLEVLSNYFKDKESQLQKELSKQESMWMEKHGEATSTIERIKYMQEELQNFKAQNESLKQEIVCQEVELKSQISVLEKKAHESWVLARQAERRLEDARQEAAQLRNRLTLKERNLIEDKGQNRLQSPLEQNGEIPISSLQMSVESPASPPLLFGARDHLTTSPPIPGLPPFLPPPPGVPFMPPHIPGVPPGFMPPPPSMFPGDHRPPPLGRMSSPPINSRYSPGSRYSPYDRNSPSPPYDDYGPSPPPMHRAYSPYNNRDDRRDYRRPPPLKHRSNGKNEGAYSSGSANSNESIEKITRHHSKV